MINTETYEHLKENTLFYHTFEYGGDMSHDDMVKELMLDKEAIKQSINDINHDIDLMGDDFPNLTEKYKRIAKDLHKLL